MVPAAASPIDDYLKDFPPEAQKAMAQVRAAIRAAAPRATEKIAWRMPTFVLDGKYLVHFAGYRRHVGFYPLPHVMESFKKDLAGYATGKGSVRFPLDRAVPAALIKRMVKARMQELLADREA